MIEQQTVDAYLDRQSELDLLRFITCGSVDDGKSTLIGRMLYEAQLIFEDQVAALRDDSRKLGTQGDDIDFALLVDGLAAEREQGITIDVAYRFFSTENRKFIVADTPGHEQYTRNMVTGASTADVAVILVDATRGILTQTRRHSFIVSLLGIRHVALAVNKMDLVDFNRDIYERILEEYREFASRMNFDEVTAIPLSALKGDNVIERSPQTRWYSGPTLMGYLEIVAAHTSTSSRPFRFPVQWVNRPDRSFRGFSGTVVSGSVSPGDRIRVLPSGQEAGIKDIVLYEDHLETAISDQAVTLTLDREIDCSRGDVIVSAREPGEVADQFEANLVWMDQEKGHVGRAYWLKIGTTLVNATISDIKFKYNINTLAHLPSRSFELNDIGVATLALDKPVPFEPYTVNRALGAFVLIDRYSSATVAAGMMNFALRRARNIHTQALMIDRAARESLNGHPARVIWLTGISGSGKSSIADLLEQKLHRQGVRTYVLDGDNLRHGLSQDLGFSDADRVENIRRVAEVAKLMVDAGLLVITAFISPFRAERDAAKRLFSAGDFIEVHVDLSVEEAGKRDPKGLYAKAFRGDLPNFTGLGSQYEAPEAPEVYLDACESRVGECVQRILDYLEANP